MIKDFFSSGGINLYLNPLIEDGALIHAVNVESFPYGAKRKRSGYVKLDIGNGTLPATVTTIFDYSKSDGTTQYLLAKSGSVMYSAPSSGTAWTITGNGTFGNATSRVGRASLDNTMVVGDGVGSTRHTTTGTSFTNTSLAPVANYFIDYQGRIHAAGTLSDVFYSSANDASNWQTTGTSDSSSYKAPGGGKLNGITKVADRVVSFKTSGNMHKWDGGSLIDMSTTLATTSHWSIAKTEDYAMWINTLGHFGYSGGKPQLLSNAVQRYFYNRDQTGVAGTQFADIQSCVFRYDYLASIGTVTDDFLQRTVSNAVLKYDFQKNEYLLWSFANKPNCFHSFRHTDGTDKLLFSEGSQIYEYSETATSDDGEPIEASLEFLFHMGQPQVEKKWNGVILFFNPGCQATIQVAFTNNLEERSRKYRTLPSVSTGVKRFLFGKNENDDVPQSNYMFLRIVEKSIDAPWTYYGASISADPQSW